MEPIKIYTSQEFSDFLKNYAEEEQKEFTGNCVEEQSDLTDDECIDFDSSSVDEAEYREFIEESEESYLEHCEDSIISCSDESEFEDESCDDSEEKNDWPFLVDCMLTELGTHFVASPEQKFRMSDIVKVLDEDVSLGRLDLIPRARLIVACYLCQTEEMTNVFNTLHESDIECLTAAEIAAYQHDYIHWRYGCPITADIAVELYSLLKKLQEKGCADKTDLLSFWGKTCDSMSHYMSGLCESLSTDKVMLYIRKVVEYGFDPSVTDYTMPVFDEYGNVSVRFLLKGLKSMIFNHETFLSCDYTVSDKSVVVNAPLPSRNRNDDYVYEDRELPYLVTCTIKGKDGFEAKGVASALEDCRRSVNASFNMGFWAEFPLQMMINSAFKRAALMFLNKVDKNFTADDECNIITLKGKESSKKPGADVTRNYQETVKILAKSKSPKTLNLLKNAVRSNQKRFGNYQEDLLGKIDIQLKTLDKVTPANESTQETVTAQTESDILKSLHDDIPTSLRGHNPGFNLNERMIV